MKFRGTAAFVTLYLAAAVLLHGFVFWKSQNLILRGFPDFAVYYCAGSVVRQGLGHQLYDASSRFLVAKQFASDVPQFRGPLPYYHPPFEALFFLPFSYLPWLWAYLAWDSLNVVLLGAVFLLLRTHIARLREYPFLFCFLATLAFFPVFYCLLNAQDAIFLLVIYTFVFISLKTNHQTAAGLWLALGLFKFHMTLPFLLLLLAQKHPQESKRKLLYGFLPGCLVLALVSLAIAGTRAIWAYPNYVLHWEDVLVTREIPTGMPNLRGLAYLFLPRNISNAATLVASVSLLAVAAWVIRNAGEDKMFDLRFSLALAVTALVSYHAASYDLTMLVVPIVLVVNYFMAEHGLHRAPARMTILAIGILFFSPLHLLLSFRYRNYAMMALALLLFAYGITRELLYATAVTANMRASVVGRSG